MEAGMTGSVVLILGHFFDVLSEYDGTSMVRDCVERDRVRVYFRIRWLHSLVLNRSNTARGQYFIPYVVLLRVHLAFATYRRPQPSI